MVLIGSLWGSYRTLRPGSSGTEAPVLGRIETMIGEIRWRPMDRSFWTSLRRDSLLRGGDTLYAGPGSGVVVVLNDETRLSVAERSLIVISPSQEPEQPKVTVMMGRLVATAGSKELVVGLGDAAARISTGNEAEMTASKGGMQIVPLRGAVRVGDDVAQEGAVALVTAQGDTIEKRLAAQLVFPTPNAMSFVGEGGADISFRWIGKSGARLVIAHDIDFQRVAQEVLGEGTVAQVAGLGPGVYYWRVQDPQTGEPQSAERAFTVVLDRPPQLVKPVRAALLYLPHGRSTHFVWTPASDVSLYQWQLARDLEFENVVLERQVATPQIRFDGGGLGEGIYYWRVRGVSFSREPPYSEARVFRLIVKPLPRAPRLLDPELEIHDAPKSKKDPEHGHLVPRIMDGVNWLLGVGVAHAATTRTSIVLRWEKVAGVSSYELQISSDEDFRTLVVRETLAAPYYIWRQIPTRPHWWRVCSIDADGRSGQFSDPQMITAASSAPTLQSPRRGSLQILDPRRGTIPLVWSAEEFARDYDVEVASDSGFTKVLTRASSSKPQLLWPPPTTGTYYWRVRARDAGGEYTDFSHGWMLRIGLDDPVWDSDGGDFQLGKPVVLRCKPVPLGSEYQMEILREDGSVVHGSTSSDGSFAWEALGQGSFVARVRAKSGLVVSKWGTELEFRVSMLGPALLSPSGSMVRLAPDEPLTLSWKPVPGAISYQVVLERESREASVHPTTDTSLQIPGIRGDLMVLLRSVDPTGQWAAGDRQSIRVLDSLVAPKVEVSPGGRISAPGDIVSLSWSVVPGAVKYRVEIASDVSQDLQWQAFMTEGPPLSYTAGSPGSYFWRVRAVDAIEELGPVSDPEHFRIEIPVHVEESPPSRVLVGAGIGVSLGFRASVEPTLHGDLAVRLVGNPELETSQRWALWSHGRLGYQRRVLDNDGISADQHAVPLRVGLLVTRQGQTIDSYVGMGLLLGFLKATLAAPNQPKTFHRRVWPGVQGSGGVSFSLGPGQPYAEAQFSWLRRGGSDIVFDASGVSLLIGYRVWL